MKNIFRIISLLAAAGVVTAGCEKDFKPAESRGTEIKSFVFTPLHNAPIGVGENSQAVIEGNKILVYLDHNCTDYSELTPEFTLSDRAISYVNGQIQDSGVSVQDFSDDVTYDVVAENGDKDSYTVTVVTEKSLVAFDIPKDLNTSLLKDAISIITMDEHKISLELPWGSEPGIYVPTFTVPDGMRVSLDGKVLESGVTPVDFSKTLILEVSSGDGYPRLWEVSTIVHITRTECEMESFRFTAELSPSVFRDVEGIINPQAQTITVPSYWADLDAELIPTFTASEYSSVMVGGTVQESGVSAQNFSGGVVYTVMAEDGVNSKDWTVNIVRPAKFMIPDKIFRDYLKTENGAMFDGDSLIIASALLWMPTYEVYYHKVLAAGGLDDFTGVEFFPKIEGTFFYGATAESLNLSKNPNVGLVLWWDSYYYELDLSNSLCATIEINQTAGDVKIRKLTMRNMNGTAVVINGLQNQLAEIDLRGGTGSFSGNLSFVENAVVKIDKTQWDGWDENHATATLIRSAAKITVELYDADGVTVLETLNFN